MVVVNIKQKRSIRRRGSSAKDECVTVSEDMIIGSLFWIFGPSCFRGIKAARRMDKRAKGAIANKACDQGDREYKPSFKPVSNILKVTPSDMFFGLTIGRNRGIRISFVFRVTQIF